MTIKKYLEQGNLLSAKINEDMERLKELRALSVSLSSSWNMEDRVQTSRTGEAPFVRTLEKIEGQMEKIDKEMALLLDLKEQIEEVINQLPRKTDRKIMLWRFLEYMSMQEIADRIDFSRSGVKKNIQQSMQKLKLPENPILICEA